MSVGTITALNLNHPERWEEAAAGVMSRVPESTEEEFATAVKYMLTNKYSGSDGIPADILKVVAEGHPLSLLNMFNTSLVARVFQLRWKKARRALIPRWVRYGNCKVDTEL